MADANCPGQNGTDFRKTRGVFDNLHHRCRLDLLPCAPRGNGGRNWQQFAQLIVGSRSVGCFCAVEIIFVAIHYPLSCLATVLNLEEYRSARAPCRDGLWLSVALWSFSISVCVSMSLFLYSKVLLSVSVSLSLPLSPSLLV